MTLFSQALISRKEFDTLTRGLVGSAAGTLGIRVFAIGISFVLSILLARFMGPSEYGVYTYVMAWVGVLVIPAVLGLDKLLVRNMPAYQYNAAWSLMNGFFRMASQAALLASLGLSLLATGFSWMVIPDTHSQVLVALWLAWILLPLLALMRLIQAAMQGLHWVVIGQLPETLIQPMLLIGFVVVAYQFIGAGLTAPMAVGMNVVAAGIACLTGAKLLQKSFPQVAQEADPEYQASVWIREALPLFCIAIMQIVNSRTDILLLGAIQGAEAVGFYGVAQRGSELITFFLVANNMALAPTIANLYTKGDIAGLQRIVTTSARVTLLLSLPIAVGLTVFGNWFLLLFGLDFTQGYTTLALLSIGQVVNVAMGSVGQLLIMTGHGRDAARGIGISAVLNVLLNGLLIPSWGLEGAAAATTISMILWNVLMAMWVYKRLGIHSTAFGKISLRRLG